MIRELSVGAVRYDLFIELRLGNASSRNASCRVRFFVPTESVVSGSSDCSVEIPSRLVECSIRHSSHRDLAQKPETRAY